MKNIYLSIISILIVSCSSPKADNTSQKTIDAFFFEYQSDVDNAINNLFTTNSLIDIDNEQIADLKKQLNTSISSLGQFNGVDFINRHTTGNSLEIYSYLVKYDKQPMRFQFTLYKPKDKWMIYNFQYDFKLNDELIKSSQLYFLKETFQND